MSLYDVQPATPSPLYSAKYQCGECGTEVQREFAAGEETDQLSSQGAHIRRALLWLTLIFWVCIAGAVVSCSLSGRTFF
jgi:hypothetical protein